MAAGMARGAHARGKLIAFGDGRKILWSSRAKEVFLRNPNVAMPGHEHHERHRLEWVNYHIGHRIYQHTDPRNPRYIWNYEFKAKPGELFFDRNETEFSVAAGKGFILIEPNLPYHKPTAVNKQWAVGRYQEVVDALVGNSCEVVQLDYSGIRHRLRGVRKISTKSSRQAFAILSRAALYIGPEGGMHHAAAALGIPAVVIFGGFIPAKITGYDDHVNLDAGVEACGWKKPCVHCKKAMDAIGVDEVLAAAWRQLDGCVRRSA